MPCIESVGNLALNWGIVGIAKYKKLDESQWRFVPIVLSELFPEDIP
jgi:hypothetical protein